ncbi:MAG: ABC transporter permease [Candidatus Micrarchaeia archaeon]
MAGTHTNGSSEKLLDGKKVSAIVKKNWMVMKKDKVRLFFLLLFPLVMILIYGFTAGEVPKHVSAAIVDYDNSNFSQMVQSNLYTSEIFSIKRQVSSQDEGKRLVEEGKVKILFIIPKGFEKDIKDGKTASMLVIVDEADPTIAQINKASTRLFVQSLSSQLYAQRMKAVAAKAAVGEQYASMAQKTIEVAAQDNNEQRMNLIKNEYRSSKQLSAKTASTLGDTIEGLKNSLGYLIDQNEIASAYSPGPGFSGSLAALASGDTQQATLLQISTYGGLQAVNAKTAASMAKVYYASEANYATSLAEKEAISASYEMVNSAKQQMNEISSIAKINADNPPIALTEIEPYGSGRPGLDFLIPSILALIIFQGAVMGLGRAVAGERKDGSMTRVFLTPTSNVTIISGTLLYYILLETIRSSIIVFVAILLFGVTIKGSLAEIFVVIAIYAAGATGLGMIMSVIAKSQEQYMSIAMLATLPTMFLSGVFLPIETMPPVLQGISNAIPVTYASDALRGIMIKGFSIWQVMPDMTFLIVFALATLVASVLLFKRELL